MYRRECSQEAKRTASPVVRSANGFNFLILVMILVTRTYKGGVPVIWTPKVNWLQTRTAKR